MPFTFPYWLPHSLVPSNILLNLLGFIVCITQHIPMTHKNGLARHSGGFVAGDVPLEIGVLQRVVLYRDRKPLLAGDQARAPSHRPALQNPVQRQAEIVVQPGRVVLLNDKDVAHLVRRAPSRLGCRRASLQPQASPCPVRHEVTQLPVLST